jgi:hypothetical protein
MVGLDLRFYANASYTASKTNVSTLVLEAVLTSLHWYTAP